MEKIIKVIRREKGECLILFSVSRRETVSELCVCWTPCDAALLMKLMELFPVGTQRPELQSDEMIVAVSNAPSLLSCSVSLFGLLRSAG